jgi:hypothetical protein
MTCINGGVGKNDWHWPQWETMEYDSFGCDSCGELRPTVTMDSYFLFNKHEDFCRYYGVIGGDCHYYEEYSGDDDYGAFDGDGYVYCQSTCDGLCKVGGNCDACYAAMSITVEHHWPMRDAHLCRMCVASEEMSRRTIGCLVGGYLGESEDRDTRSWEERWAEEAYLALRREYLGW